MITLTPEELTQFVQWTNISLGSCGVLPVTFSVERDGLAVDLTHKQITKLHHDLNYIDVSRYVRQNTEQLRVMISEIAAHEQRVK